jgi:hypothetical protein
MARLAPVIRRWCDTCQRVTVSWWDNYREERCTGCDPESGVNPGWGVHDWDADDD